MSKILYGDLGGTKSILASKDYELIEKITQFLIDKKITIIERGKTREYYYVKFKSVKLKDLSIEALANSFNVKLFLSIAGVPIYNKRDLVKVISIPLGNYEFKTKRIYAFNDVKSFSYYWVDIFDYLLAIQIGTGVNGAFYTKRLIKDWNYLISPVEFGELRIEKEKVGNLLGGRHYNPKNLNKIDYSNKVSVFLRNLLYIFPAENVVIGGGMARYIDKESLIKNLNSDSILNIIRKIKTLKILETDDWIYNIMGLELIRKTFFND